MEKKLDDLTVEHIKHAVEMCGYDFREMTRNHTRKRTYVDVRSVIFELCQAETGAMPKEIGRKFGWHRCTVYHAIGKAKELREYDKQFRNMYDSIRSHYMIAESIAEDYEGEHNEDVNQGIGRPVVEEER